MEKDAAPGRVRRVAPGSGLAFALPAVVIVVCLMLPIGLVLEVLSQRVDALAFARAPVSYGISMGLAGVAVLLILVRALADRSRARALGVAAAGIVGGCAAFAGAFWLVAIGAPSIIVLLPLATVVLAVLAAVVSLRSAGTIRSRLLIAWAVALITPFALGSPVAWLSDKVGNAGMDAAALVVLPGLALAVWWVAVLVASVVPAGGDGR